MAILDILKNELFVEQDESLDDVVSDEAPEEPTDEAETPRGDAKALVSAMIKYAPGQKDQIGIILKYAANSVHDYNIWDEALNYFESEADNISSDGVDVDSSDNGDNTNDIDDNQDDDVNDSGVDDTSLEM